MKLLGRTCVVHGACTVLAWCMLLARCMLHSAVHASIPLVQVDLVHSARTISMQLPLPDRFYIFYRQDLPVVIQPALYNLYLLYLMPASSFTRARHLLGWPPGDRTLVLLAPRTLAEYSHPANPFLQSHIVLMYVRVGARHCPWGACSAAHAQGQVRACPANKKPSDRETCWHSSSNQKNPAVVGCGPSSNYLRCWA